MTISIFVATYNFFCQASRTDARYVSTRRAFFMPISQEIDSTDKNLSAACLEWYLIYPHFNFSLGEELYVGGEEGSRFFCPRLTYNSIMSNPTTPQAELITVQVTKCQLAILNHFHGKDANDYARYLRSVCIAALSSSFDNREDIETVMWLAEAVQALATEHFETESGF